MNNQGQMMGANQRPLMRPMQPMQQQPGSMQQPIPQQQPLMQPVQPVQQMQAPPAQAAPGRRAYPQPQPQQQNQYAPPGPAAFQQQQQMGQHQQMGPQNPMMQAPQPPQFIQPAGVPQFGAPRPPQFGGAPPQQQQLQPPGPPAFGQPIQPVQPGYGGPMSANGMMPQQGMNQLQNGMQNMNMGGQQQQQQGQAPSNITNLLQRPPSAVDLLNLTTPPNMSFQSSISQSPHAICPPSYKRCTLNSIPQTQAVLSKSKVPFGLIVTPYRSILPGEEPVPVVNPPQIVRCRRCRTYINPWVQFVEQGTRWKCNMCFLTNEVPGFFDWDTETRQQVDRMKRFELTHSVVEYIAPQEYMVRPPQPVVLFFVIDVSFAAVQSGMVESVAQSILKHLDKVPNSDGRTKVAFVAVDSCLHFFNLNASLSEPQILVVSDIEDAFLPLPEDLLVTLTESRTVIEKLLMGLPGMFKGTNNSRNALGRALQMGFKMINAIGGKIVIFQTTLPNLSEGELKMREDPKLLGTPKEVTLLQPSSPFYKSFAVDCSRTQVAIDVFCFTSNYLDLATLTGLSRVTGGATYYYPTFNAHTNPHEVTKFDTELSNFFTRPLALEAVLRVRASKGIRMTRYHGNFFLRSTDLLALPAVNPDNSYGIEMEITDTLPSATACFQTALLHTNSNGERRIRVLTLTVPVCDGIGDVYTRADAYAIAALWSKKGVEKCLSSNIEAAREEMVGRLVELIVAYKNAFTSSGQNGMLLVPENLKCLPVLVMSVLKHTSFRTSGIIPSDIRSFAQAMMCVYPAEAFVPNVYARFWALHSMDSHAGTVDEATGQVVFPPVLNLSSEKLERHGLYLLDDGSDLYLWVGRAIDADLCRLVFGQPVYDGIVPGKTTLPHLPNEWNQRVNNLISNLQQTRTLMMTTFPCVHVVKEDGDAALRMQFLSHLVEDKLESGNSYPLFLGYLREKMNKPSGMFS
ncbi:COPII subunit [Podochytrium sp. JEL0797]|nr:COPII subunit [Podochytrium sp. JEL0797]